MSLKQRVTTALESGLNVFIEVLKFVDTAANVFPPLLLIAQTLKTIGSVLFSSLEG